MRVIDYPGLDTVFLELNADSTFLYKNLSGTWNIRKEKFLELTLPPRQELYVMSFRIVHVSKNQLIIQGPGTGPDAEPQIFTRIEQTPSNPLFSVSTQHRARQDVSQLPRPRSRIPSPAKSRGLPVK
jgi:hypothetical protein